MGGWEPGREASWDNPVVLSYSGDLVGLFLPLKPFSTVRVAEVNVNVFSSSWRPESKVSLTRITKVKVWVGLVPRGSGEDLFGALSASWMTASLELWHSPSESNLILRPRLQPLAPIF